MRLRYISFPILLLILSFSLTSLTAQKIDHPTAVDGVVNLTSYTNESGRSFILLNGTWEFYPEQFLTDFSNIENRKKISVPAEFGDEFKNKNYGTYRLNMILPSKETPYGITVQDIRSAYRLYINGELVKESGVTGRNHREEKPENWKGVLPLIPDENNRAELVIQVSNFNSRKGGITENLYFGELLALRNGLVKINRVTFALFGAFFIMGFYQLIFFLFRRKERASLFFGLLCFSLAFRILLVNFIGHTDILPIFKYIPWEILKKGEYLTFYLIAWSFVSYFSRFFPGKYNKLFSLATSVITIIALLPILIFPYRIYNRLLIIYQIYIFLAGIFIMASVIFKISKKSVSSYYFLTAFIFIFAGSILDVLSNQLIIQIPPVSFISFLLFILTQSLALSRRYSNTFSSIETLSRDLNRLLEERRRYEMILKRRVDERTRELKATTEEANVANRAKSDFLARMSHEIRTPLNGIMGFAEIISESHNREDQEKYSGLIVEESEKLLTLLNQLLDLSKMDAGEMSVDSRPFDLSQLLDSMEQSFRPRIEAKQLQFKISAPPVKDLLMGDPFRLRQILINLLGNASKFTREGSIHLEVTTTFDSDESIGLLFSIKDTGIGIPKEKQQEIFHDFSQGDNSITREFGGTGLGTSISRSLVNLMGGAIGLESTAGEGSTFWFEIRFKRKSKPETLDIGKPITYSYKKMNLNVLLAEDYQANQEVATKHLENVGCHVTLAENGVEAVRLFKDKDFDVICMDIHMPEMDGYTATEKIRESEKGGKVIIIGLTADAYDETRARALAAGMNDVLTKPLRRTSFLESVAKWTGHHAELELENL